MKIAIASGKGGTGKTFLATNLAVYLAENFPVILTDLDVEEPNSGLFIDGITDYEKDMVGMVPEWDNNSCILCGDCREICSFNAIVKLPDRILLFPELCHSCYACSELCPKNALPMVPRRIGVLKYIKLGRLHFIESKLEIGEQQAVPLIARTIDFVDNDFDSSYIKLFDSPPGTSCPVIEVIKDTDLVILVTEPTPFGLHDLQLAVETCRKLKKYCCVVINRDGIGDNEVERYCYREALEIIAKIPNNRIIAEYYSQGKLVYPHLKELAFYFQQIGNYVTERRGGFNERDSYNLR